MQKNSFRYLVFSEIHGSRRAYGVIVAPSSSPQPRAIVRAVTHCRTCAQLLRSTLEYHAVYPEHARDVLRDLTRELHHKRQP